MSSCFSNKFAIKTILNCIIGILAFQLTINAFGDQFDTLSYSALVGISYDDNIFRLPSWADPMQIIGQPTKSDLISTETLGINIDKYYSNQEVQLKANVTNNTFNTFSYLNYINTNYSALWNWNLTPRFSGTLSDSRAQTLNSYADIHIYSRNLTTTDTPHLAADWWLTSNWHLTIGATDSKTTSSQSVVNNQSYISQILEWGAKYLPGDGSSFAIVSRIIQNQNINSTLNYFLLADTQNTETQKEFNFTFPLSGKTGLSGNLLSINHQYPTFYQRDYSGVEGDANFFWSIRDKTNLNISFNRGISSWNDFASSYYISDTVTIAPNWQITNKTTMLATISRGKSNYFGPIFPGTMARVDQTQSALLGVDWIPQRSIKISVSLQNSARTSNYSSYEFNDRSANLSLQINF